MVDCDENDVRMTSAESNFVLSACGPWFGLGRLLVCVDYGLVLTGPTGSINLIFLFSLKLAAPI